MFVCLCQKVMQDMSHVRQKQTALLISVSHWLFKLCNFQPTRKTHMCFFKNLKLVTLLRAVSFFLFFFPFSFFYLHVCTLLCRNVETYASVQYFLSERQYQDVLHSAFGLFWDKTVPISCWWTSFKCVVILSRPWL